MRQIDSDIILLEPGDHAVMPWKNGGGTTREILAHPAGSAAFDWRLSIADVASDGDFSLFPDHARTIMLLEGRGMHLRFGAVSEARVTEPFQPLDFDGGAHTHCRLVDGPVRDFNIMSARARCRHEHAVITHFPCTLEKRLHAASVVFCARGRLTVRPGSGPEIPLQAEDTLVMDGEPQNLQIDAATGSRALAVRFFPAGLG
ncbi:MAG TPA: HutD family protein [Gammaproteobacteria bacterium]